MRNFLSAEFGYDLDKAITEGRYGPGVRQFRRAGEADYCSKGKTVGLELYGGRNFRQPFSAYSDNYKKALAANLLHELAHHARDMSGNKGWVPRDARITQMVNDLAGSTATDIPRGSYEGYYVNLLIGVR